ncbi:MAG TPA: hypothetical protein VMU92_12565 [Acidobacteriaceae bacterium]|nr:hypothetical protein [Acidobacteriaceae bacterium]
MKYAASALLAFGISMLILGCGATSIAPSGSATTISAPGSAGTGQGGGSGASQTGTVISKIQTPIGNWRSWGQAPPSYTDCAAPCSQSTWSQTYGIQSPAKSGNATEFSLNPNIPYADVLFGAGLIGQNSPQMPDSSHTLLPTLHNFTYDADFYVENSAITQALEFDVEMHMNSVGMTWGTMCNHLQDGKWDIWDNVNKHWVSAGVPCEYKNGWNHITIQLQRGSGNTLLYQSIALNGTVYTLNKTYPPGTAPSNWYGLDLNYQMDSNSAGAPLTTYVDNLTLTYW